MTIGIDLVSAVVGLIAIFAHLVNKVRRLVKLSHRILEMRLEHLDFQRKISELARAARQSLPLHRREMLDECVQMCQENYKLMEVTLLKIQASRFKHGRALLESFNMRQLQKASEASTGRLKNLLISNQLDARYDISAAVKREEDVIGRELVETSDDECESQ